MGQYMLERGSKGAERLQPLSRILSPTYDKKFFDNWTHWILKKAGLA